MWQIRKNRLAWCCGLALVLGFASDAAGQSVDPVEDLRQALPMRLEDLAAPTPAVLGHRKELLEKKVAGLKTIPQLRRALMLEEWKDDPARVVNEKLRLLDTALRTQIGQRLKKEISVAVSSPDPNRRLAVANLIAEMGPSVRALDPLDRGGFTRGLMPEVLQLNKDKDLAVRQESLRALGNINPKPKEAAAVFRATLAGDKLGPRRLAADGLCQIVRVITHLQKRSRTASGVDAGREDVLETAREVLQTCVAGFKDEDMQVRALCLTAYELAAQAIAEQIPDPFNKKDFPPEGRPWSEEERTLNNGRMATVIKEAQDWRSGLSALRATAPSIVSALSDPEVIVRLSAIQALEQTANTRLRLRKRVMSVRTEKGELHEKAKEYLEAEDPMTAVVDKHLPAITKLLADADTRVRRTTLVFFENLEDSAVAVLPAIIATLSDPDRFVRWSAARILGQMPVEKASVATPQLARLLSDFDLSVRMAAAQTLENFGPAAKEAAPALARAVGEGDAEARIEVMRVLQRLAPDVAQVAVPQLTDALRHSDPRIRRFAADTLGRLGSFARDALPALRRALGDEDNEVRSQASDAILNITTLDR